MLYKIIVNLIIYDILDSIQCDYRRVGGMEIWLEWVLSRIFCEGDFWLSYDFDDFVNHLKLGASSQNQIPDQSEDVTFCFKIFFYTSKNSSPYTKKVGAKEKALLLFLQEFKRWHMPHSSPFLSWSQELRSSRIM